MVWRDPVTGGTRVQAAEEAELLALKVVVEEIPLAKAARAAKTGVPVVENALWRAAEKGILLAPRSRIRRDPALFPIPAETPAAFTSSPAFLIQWHITQACDLRCKHCYDRSKRSPLTLEQGVKLLDDLRRFCGDRRVRGHVCFTGGNPFLHPHFEDLWRAAAERGFPLSILGNPVPRAALEKLLAVERPQYYQVSLEGLPEYNDRIRGAGHFARTIEFFGVLRDLEVESTVMLTVARDNLEQVLPLAERLRGHTRRFNFNRLSQVGEGAALAMPSRADYAAFLEKYLAATKSNPILSLKDNLFNILPAAPRLGAVRRLHRLRMRRGVQLRRGAARRRDARLPQIPLADRQPAPAGVGRNLRLRAGPPIPRRLPRLRRLPAAPDLRRLHGHRLRARPERL